MCINKLFEDEEKKELEKLKDVFPCWKVIRKSGYCEYDLCRTQPKFTRKTHQAENHPDRRIPIDYPPGFHAYLRKPKLNSKDYIVKVVKCWARKKDIVRIGYSGGGFRDILSVAVLRITRK